MSKKTVTTADILYICIPTAQNTINIYPLTPMCVGLSGKIYVHLVTSQGAQKLKWDEKLRSVFSEIPQISSKFTGSLVDESLRYSALLGHIVRDINENYILSADAQIVVNFGGGLKIFTPVLFALPARFAHCKFVMAYPEKTEHKMVWDTMINGKIDSSTPLKSLEIGITSLQLFSMYSIDREFYGFHTIHTDKSQIDDKFVVKISGLSNVYLNEEFRNLLHRVSNNKSNSQNENTNEDNITENQFFDKLQKNKELIKNNVRAKFKAAATGWLLNSNYDFIEDATYQGKKRNINQLPTKIINSFFEKDTYATSSTPLTKLEGSKNLYNYIISTNDLRFLSSAVEILDNDSFQFLDNKSIIQNIFSEYSHAIPSHYSKDGLRDISDHGVYFELLCLKIVTEWAKQNPSKIREVCYSFLVTKKLPSGNLKNNQVLVGAKEFEVDIMVFTSEGTIIYFECKTGDFTTKNFLAAYQQAMSLGGVFNKYYIILPPLPTIDSIDFERISKVYNGYSKLTEAINTVTCCTLDTSGYSTDLKIKSLNDELDLIITSEIMRS